VQKSRRGVQIAKDFQDPKGSHGGQFAGAFGYLKAEPYVGLAGQMIELVWLDAGENSSKRCGVCQIGIMEEKTLAIDVLIVHLLIKTRTLEGATTANNPVNFVPFAKE
jgi:hypothetical protein